jgi:hypothetical protein
MIKAYITVLIGFFRYLEQNLDITNIDILVTVGSNKNLAPEFTEIIKQVSVEYELSDNLTKSGIIAEDKAREIIVLCNNVIDEYVIKDPYARKSGVSKYKSLICHIVIKLILHTGLSCTRLPDIKLIKEKPEDIILSEHCDSLNVRGYNIKLPSCMSEQLQQYLELRKLIVNHTKTTNASVFLSLDGNTKFGNVELKSNRFICYVISKVVGNSSYLSIAKYAVCQMITSFIDRGIIKKITGFGDGVIDDCIFNLSYNGEFVEKEKSFVESQLTQHNLFDLL